MKKPLDRFSKQSSLYKKFRPSYPTDLYEFIFKECKHFDSAWDCATGNGQVALVLSEKFSKVFATDISEKQLQKAQQKENIEYLLSRAEETPFEGNVFDLVTVGQALHWFSLHDFFKEVHRVLKPEGIFAVWGYGLLHISSEIDEIISKFYYKTIVDYWDFDRSLIENSYKTIPFPFEEIAVRNTFKEEVWWTIEHFEGYFNSWSSVQNFKDKHGENPVDQLVSEVSKYWTSNTLKVTFPIFMRVGKNL